MLVLRHHEEDSAGLVADAFADRGAEISVHLYPDDGPLPTMSDYDHVVVLGSKWSVYDDAAVGSWIDEELAWLRKAGSGALPVFGICFGAQLLTTAFGGVVERSPRYEIGWVTVEPAAHPSDERDGERDGERSADVGPDIGRGPWFQFHGDRCVLPPSATLLAHNDVGVQAFAIGRNLGVQFHPEIDAPQLQRWLDHGGRRTVERAGIDPDGLLAQTAAEEPAARRRAGELVDAYLERAGR